MADALEASLEVYKTQLNTVEEALKTDPDNADLKTLSDDLGQLIELTTQSVVELKKKELLARVSELEAEDGDDNEDEPADKVLSEETAEEPEQSHESLLGQLKG